MPLDQSCHLIVCFFWRQNISIGYSKQLPQWDGLFDHIDHMLKLADDKMNTILHAFLYI